MLGKKNILVVDDDRVLVKLLQSTLEKNGYLVTTACNGADGLQKIKEVKPDLIILDINMPKMGGIEFFGKICDSHSKPKYPIFVLTARENFERLFREFDIVGFMTKPFDTSALLREIRIVFDQKAKLAKKNKDINRQKPKSICIVENIPEIFEKMVFDFLSAGYTVSSATSGATAVERVMTTLPDLVLIKTGLKDIPGDVVILRLQNMLKTINVQYVLYTQKNDKLNETILEELAKKCNVGSVVQYENPSDLLEFVSQEF